jgi:hypothetical protein
MGLFDNIIGTANDGEAATDMDTIIENMANAKETPPEESSQDGDKQSSNSGTGGGDGGAGRIG